MSNTKSQNSPMLGKILRSMGVLKQTQIEQVLAQQRTDMAGKLFGEIALELELVSRSQLKQALVNQGINLEPVSAPVIPPTRVEPPPVVAPAVAKSQPVSKVTSPTSQPEKGISSFLDTTVQKPEYPKPDTIPDTPPPHPIPPVRIEPVYEQVPPAPEKPTGPFVTPPRPTPSSRSAAANSVPEQPRHQPPSPRPVAPPPPRLPVPSSDLMEKILLEFGVKPSHVKASLARAQMTGEPLTQIMRDFGFLSPEQVAEALSRQTGMPYFSKKEAESINVTRLQMLPEFEFRGFVPVDYADNGTLTVAVPDMTTLNTATNEYFEYKTRVVIASDSTIQNIYRKHFAHTEQQFDLAVDEFLKFANKRRQEDDDPGLIRGVLGTLLRHACYAGASDIYVYKSEYVGVIKLKINGAGQLFRSIPETVFDRLMTKLVTDNSKPDDLKREPMEAVVEFKADEDHKKYEDIINRFGFRLELAESRGQRTAVIRILDKQSSATEMDKLGLDPDTEKSLNSYINTSTGLVIVTGPTGSGKTTSLYAMLKSIDPVERSIQSIENPVEYRHGLWMQYELIKTSKSEGEEFNKWLKALLRNAPDVILMGEVRDAHVANILLDAANTGHLVFTTLHTNTAALALSRLRSLNVDPNTLANVLLGVLAQRLVRVLCNDCKLPDTRDLTLSELNKPYLISGPRTPFKQGPGCPNCNGSGYRGRQMVYELLNITPEVKKLIESDAPPSVISKAGIDEDKNLWACSLRLVSEGVTSLEEIYRVSVRE